MHYSPRTDICSPTAAFNLYGIERPVRISHSHKFVFFANPKTGSRSVRRMLDGVSEVHGCPADEVTPDFPFYNHIRPCELRGVFKKRQWDFDAYFKFVMVRNPWSRAVSLYEMISYREKKIRSRFRSRAARRKGFREWVRTLDPDGRGAAEAGIDASVRRYGAFTLLGFTGDRHRRPMVDQVVRLEDAEQELPPLFRMLGIEGIQPMPHVGKGRYRGGYRSYYDAETRDVVAELYQEDIERFGYDF